MDSEVANVVALAVPIVSSSMKEAMVIEPSLKSSNVTVVPDIAALVEPPIIVPSIAPPSMFTLFAA